jgi:hypothetical protein
VSDSIHAQQFQSRPSYGYGASDAIGFLPFSGLSYQHFHFLDRRNMKQLSNMTRKLKLRRGDSLKKWGKRLSSKHQRRINKQIIFQDSRL